MTSLKTIPSLSLAALVLLVTTANARPSSESNSGESKSVENMSSESMSSKSLSVESMSSESISVENMPSKSMSVESISSESISVKSMSVESSSTESKESNETMQGPENPPVVGGPTDPNIDVLPLTSGRQSEQQSGRHITEEGATSSSEESTENEESTESKESPDSPESQETSDESEPVDPVDPNGPISPEVAQRKQNRGDDSSSSESTSEESEEDDDIEGLPVCTIMNVANGESQNRICPPFHECDPFPIIPLENGEGMTVYRIGVCRRTPANDVQFLASVDCNPDGGACQTFSIFDRGVYQDISLPGGILTFATFDELEAANPPTEPVAP